MIKIVWQARHVFECRRPHKNMEPEVNFTESWSHLQRRCWWTRGPYRRQRFRFGWRIPEYFCASLLVSVTGPRLQPRKTRTRTFFNAPTACFSASSAKHEPKFSTQSTIYSHTMPQIKSRSDRTQWGFGSESRFERRFRACFALDRPTYRLVSATSRRWIRLGWFSGWCHSPPGEIKSEIGRSVR